jgi:hypothetical protein
MLQKKVWAPAHGLPGNAGLIQQKEDRILPFIE